MAYLADHERRFTAIEAVLPYLIADIEHAVRAYQRSPYLTHSVHPGGVPGPPELTEGLNRVAAHILRTTSRSLD